MLDSEKNVEKNFQNISKTLSEKFFFLNSKLRLICQTIKNFVQRGYSIFPNCEKNAYSINIL